MAKSINQGFEPVWVSVRPVPLVTIDFGEGNKIKRTLHGNVATYVCDNNGHVLDVLPGIYEPVTYIDRLDRLSEIFQEVVQGGDAAQQKIAVLRRYHGQAVEALSNSHQSSNPINDATKLDASKHEAAIHNDTHINEVHRRKLVHVFLSDAGLVQPDDMKSWLYREVLHADLDDPWLGLEKTLFGSYPFAEEDSSRP